MVRAPSVGSGVTVLTELALSPQVEAERVLLAVLSDARSSGCRGVLDVRPCGSGEPTAVMRAVVQLATPATRQAMPQLGPVLQGGI